MVTMVCPHCATRELSTLEKIYGGAPVNGITRNDAGDIEVDYQGDTEVFWDSSVTIGILCRDCFWEYEGEDWIDQLIPEEKNEEFEE